MRTHTWGGVLKNKRKLSANEPLAPKFKDWTDVTILLVARAGLIKQQGLQKRQELPAAQTFISIYRRGAPHV